MTRGVAGAPPRAKTGDFFRDVRSELRKVAWPTRIETLNYAAVVFVTLVLITSVIFGLDFVFSKFALFLFKR